VTLGDIGDKLLPWRGVRGRMARDNGVSSTTVWRHQNERKPWRKQAN